MVNWKELIKFHRSKGKIKEAYVNVSIENHIVKLNVFSMQLKPVSSVKDLTPKWQLLLNREIHKDKQLEKEVREFQSIFDLLSKYHMQSGIISKSESPDFIIQKRGKSLGIEITKIYVGYDWMLEKISNEIKEYRLNKEDARDYIDYKKANDKVEILENNGEIIISPKLFPMMNTEYSVMIKNKILEKIRKLFDDYQKYDENVIYAEITSPEYFEDVTDLDAFSEEIFYYISHLEELLDEREYKLVIRLNRKWIELDLKTGKYQTL